MSQTQLISEELTDQQDVSSGNDNVKKSLTGVERFFDVNELIVSKTDLTGRLTYVNDVFMRVGGYNESELLGVQHNIIRHPDMPRCIFKLLWDALKSGEEIFAYVNNRAKNGDNYWVFAHVTPSFDKDGNVVSYHSSRRLPKPETIKNTIAPFYKQLLEAEQSVTNRKAALEKSYTMLTEFIANQGVEYDEFILSI